MSDESETFEGIVQPVDDVFTEEALRDQDGNVVPLRLEIGGPVIGTATMKYDDEEKILKANFKIDDPKVAEQLRHGSPPYFS